MHSALPLLLKTLQSNIGHAQIKLKTAQVAVPKKGIKKFLHDRGWTAESRQLKKIEADVNQLVKAFHALKQYEKREGNQNIRSLVEGLNAAIPKLMKSSMQVVKTGKQFFSKIACTKSGQQLRSAQLESAKSREQILTALQKIQEIQAVERGLEIATQSLKEYASQISFNFTALALHKAIGAIIQQQKKDPINHNLLMANFTTLQQKMIVCQQELMIAIVTKLKIVYRQVNVIDCDQKDIQQLQLLLQNVQHQYSQSQDSKNSLEKRSGCYGEVKKELENAQELLSRVDKGVSVSFYKVYQSQVPVAKEDSPFFLGKEYEQLLEDEQFKTFAGCVNQAIQDNPMSLTEPIFALNSGEKGTLINKIDDILISKKFPDPSADVLIPFLRVLIVAIKDATLLSDKTIQGLQGEVTRCRSEELKANSDKEKDDWGQKEGILQFLILAIDGVKKSVLEKLEIEKKG